MSAFYRYVCLPVIITGALLPPGFGTLEMQAPPPDFL